MKTQEELRDWVRQGMPVPEEPEPINWGCTAFVVKVWPIAWPIFDKGRGQMSVQCEGCGKGTTKEDQEPRAAIIAVREWMVRHAVGPGGLRYKDAVAAFGTGRNWADVGRTMLKGKAETYKAELAFPGDGTGERTVRVESMAEPQR